MSNMTETCECGRICKSRSGFATHARSCPIEQKRKSIFLRCIEGGLNPYDYIDQWRRNGRPVDQGAVTGTCSECWGMASHQAVVVEGQPTMRSWDRYVQLHAAHKSEAAHKAEWRRMQR